MTRFAATGAPGAEILTLRGHDMRCRDDVAQVINLGDRLIDDDDTGLLTPDLSRAEVWAVSITGFLIGAGLVAVVIAQAWKWWTRT